jgi:hypothetical protein
MLVDEKLYHDTNVPEYNSLRKTKNRGELIRQKEIINKAF